MLTYKEALSIAKTKKEKINRCTEYTNAYSFSYDSGGHQVGGDSPVVVMKDTGKTLDLISYAITPNKEYVKDFDVE